MTSGGIFDLENKLEQITRIETEMASPSFWENTQKAQALVQERNELIRIVSPWQELREKVEELRLLWEMASEEGDESVAAEIEDGVKAVRTTLEEFRLKSVLSGQEDRKNAIVSIHPGAGGTESQDWAQMLLRMYTRWAERHGYKIEVVDLLPGEEAGIKSATLTITGDSDRPPVRAGSDETWDKAEAALREATEAAGLEWTLNPGEGAFYGPKLEFVLRDAIGRDWQCGTLQADFVLPERLGAQYVGEDGAKHVPVMLHRAVLGSFERFIGRLIENFAGKFPLWLAPVQAVVCTITDEAAAYAEDVAKTLAGAGLRVETDLRNEKINYKVREHSLAKVPVLVVVGKREAEERTVALRRLGGASQEVLALAEATAILANEAAVP